MHFLPPRPRASQEKATPVVMYTVCRTAPTVPLNQGSCNAASVPGFLVPGSHVLEYSVRHEDNRLSHVFFCWGRSMQLSTAARG
jgi:hypothetical protein